MKGRKIDKVIFTEPSLWSFALGDISAIGVECPWRIIKEERIVLSVEDHLQLYGLTEKIEADIEAEKLLKNESIESVVVKTGTLDIIITFKSGKRLEIIPLSSGYESWNIIEPTNTTIIALGGGELAKR